MDESLRTTPASPIDHAEQLVIKLKREKPERAGYVLARTALAMTGTSRFGEYAKIAFEELAIADDRGVLRPPLSSERRQDVQDIIADSADNRFPANIVVLAEIIDEVSLKGREEN